MDLLTSIAVFKCPQLYFSEVDDSKSYLQEVAKRMLTKKGEKRILNYDIEFTSKTIGNYFSRGTEGDLIKKTLILAVPQILENGVVIYDWASPHLDKNINKVEFLMVAAPVVLCK